ncbi:MAG: TetR/AcrR family transcriptional regulator [Oscillospiraceae bacterium]
MKISKAEQEERKLKVISAAYKLFCDRGIDKVNIDSLAKASGVSHASISRYFKNKAELLFYTQQILWQDIVQKLHCHNQSLIKAEVTGLARFNILLHDFEMMYQDYPEYVLFTFEYKMHLLKNGIRLSNNERDRMLGSVKNYFSNVIILGQLDGTITTKYSVDEIFNMSWRVMRCVVEQIVLYDKIYEQDNPWQGAFNVAINKIILEIKA